MGHSPFALFCSGLLVWSALTQATWASQVSGAVSNEERERIRQARVQLIRDQVSQFQSGSTIEVRLVASSKKIKGRLGAVTETGFELTRFEKGQTGRETLSFADVHEVNKFRKWTPGKKILIGVLVFVAVIASVGIATSTSS